MLWDDLGGGMGVGGGRYEREGIYVHGELIHFVGHQSKHNSVKQLYSKLKKEEDI